MAFTLLRNTSQGVLTLPSPFRGMLQRGQAIVLPTSVSVLNAAFTGDSGVSPPGVALTELPADYGSATDTFYGASTPVFPVVTASQQLDDVDAIVPVDTTLGVVTLTLPAGMRGRQQLFQRINPAGTNGIILARAPGVLINAVDADYTLPDSGFAQVARWHGWFDGASWWVG